MNAIPEYRRVTLALAALCVAVLPAHAAERGCGQSLIDGTTPPATAFVIEPSQPARPFYQWENNNGYCGEVSMMQAGLANGQWMSQFDARLICGTGLLQSGPNGACATHHDVPNYNAQLLIEDPHTGVSGPDRFAHASLCLANSRLAFTTFPYLSQSSGAAGYREYMSWVKHEVIAGHQVTLAVLDKGGGDQQYDHEVTVLRIGTNHAPTDPAYYPDDVVYFDDHGAYTLRGHHYTYNPAIPPGAGDDDTGCTPYVFAYSFGALPKTRRGANEKTAHAYSVILPDDRPIRTGSGGNGYDKVTIHGPHNYAFSVSGPADRGGETVPVALQIVAPTQTRGTTNPRDPIAGYDYENPMVGRNAFGNGCSNAPPAPWMDHLVLRATVSDLKPGASYNLYEYELSAVRGVGAAASLAMPVDRFNANASEAHRVTGFTATGTQFSQTVTVTSDKIVAFRCVPADAP